MFLKCHPRILRLECSVRRRFKAAHNCGCCLVLREDVRVVLSSSLIARSSESRLAAFLRQAGWVSLGRDSPDESHG